MIKLNFKNSNIPKNAKKNNNNKILTKLFKRKVKKFCFIVSLFYLNSNKK
jgi:hypothetical protein